MLHEINFDSIIGPSHNFSGLSLGNLAATYSQGQVSRPRDAALQGLAKMRANIALGLVQGVLLPHHRPDEVWLRALGSSAYDAEPGILANAMSASPMWAANAATVSPSPDTLDGRCHLTVANLNTMPHRSHEWPQTLAQLQLAFANSEHFVVHPPVPAPFGDEGAANHMRLCSNHSAAGVEIFVYGEPGGSFPARQHRLASAAVARLHGLDLERTLFCQQSPEAIAAGAFHNDVVAVANEHVLFAHEQAFVAKEKLYDALLHLVPEVEIIEVPSSAVSLEDAIRSYLFNAQLVTLPNKNMALILPMEARRNERVWDWLKQHVVRNSTITELVPVEVRESMSNGGGPACLRLRVVANPSTIDPRFLMNPSLLDRCEHVIARYWPESINPADLGEPSLWAQCRAGRAALLTELGFAEHEL